jgi:hypothetical protein
VPLCSLVDFYQRFEEHLLSKSHGRKVLVTATLEMAVSDSALKSCVCHNPRRRFPEASKHHSCVAMAPETSATSIRGRPRTPYRVCTNSGILTGSARGFTSLNPIIRLSIGIYTLCAVITCIYTAVCCPP